MARLLYLESSPRKERSHSIAAAKAFLEAYRKAHPNDAIETLDLWAEELPPFDGDMLAAKYAVLHGESHTPQQKAAWARVEAMGERFKRADKYLFSLPMWNFGIPYRLKHYIDIITQPGVTFRFSPETGYDGLVKGRPATVVYASGGSYEQGSSYDFQKPYLRLWLGFIGFSDIREVAAAPTLGAPEAVGKAQEAALRSARALGAAF